MWSWILKAVLAVSKNPEVQAWVENKALEVINGILHKANTKAQAVADATGVDHPALLPPATIR